MQPSWGFENAQLISPGVSFGPISFFMIICDSLRFFFCAVSFFFGVCLSHIQKKNEAAKEKWPLLGAQAILNLFLAVAVRQIQHQVSHFRFSFSLFFFFFFPARDPAGLTLVFAANLSVLRSAQTLHTHSRTPSMWNRAPTPLWIGVPGTFCFWKTRTHSQKL